ncbi:MAG: 1-(5-phosphoribosyl)-5-[(5-phosphoribosylamino)methylideneamino] imidazole-4-carboxamide isomerase [Rhodovibrionaceae bacterium]|nr:1-(5-phosphoribosyl)-5-[(5-phosphoribosylamino)methylideneamino] imidazole-4-carboxamide isomerase [Rhodovibrionaceae bacterium]
MIIYPDIELRRGQCVNLLRGRMEEPVVYDVDPVETAKNFQAKGAEVLHVVDLDGAMQGGRHNAELIREIIEAVDIPVQVGGGVRTIASVQWWFDHGAHRVVLGTAAVKDRNLVRMACGSHPGKIVVSVDARNGKVVIEGWREETTFTALDLAKSFEDSGVAEIIYTDIDLSDDQPGGTIANTMRMGEQLAIPVIASGTIKTLDDVAILKYLPNIEGCVIGRALFNGKVDLADAIKVAKEPYRAPTFV